MPADETTGRHRRQEPSGRRLPVRRGIALYSAAAVVAFAVIGALLLFNSHGPSALAVAQNESATQRADDRAADAENRASRGEARTGDTPSRQPSAAASAPAKPSTAGTTAQPPSTATAAPTTAAPTPAVIAAVGELTQAEMNNAVTIIRTGQQMGLPSRAFVVAISTALQESHLHNLANSNVPESLNLPNEGVGSDHDSVGLFQQRPNWGTVTELMNPAESARRFYNALVDVSGWQQMAITVAAQTVQVSAFPDAYAQWQSLAEQIVTAVP
ncbi:hypothetical protein ABT369_06175 [Dactylosporangium sp. NPDC000244]|uniref:hypothetical protein n=1 Tax=Dactylosporangium sp. NPDC000244 TaxID=3154365 RepID=UPI003320C9BA